MKLIKIPLSTLKHMKGQGFSDLIPYTHKNPLVRWVFWKRLEAMLKLASPAERVLEFGAGSGVFVPSLSKNFKEVYLEDLKIDSLNYIKEKYDLKNLIIRKSKGGTNENDMSMTKGNIKLRYPEEFFDIIFVGDVLEHFHDSMPLQQEFKRILKMGGCLIVSGPTENFIYKVSRRLIFWYWEKKQDHFSNIKQIMNLSEKIFSLEEVNVVPSSLIPGFKIYRVKKR